MTNLYLFNSENKEYFMTMPYEGGDIPENATFDEIPELEENECAIYEDGWQVMKDYRFSHKMMKVEGNKYTIKNIEVLGDIPEGWELITNAEAEELQERIRLNGYNMTKLDFYKYILSPNGITYETLLQVLSQNIELKAVWDLCERVYRGDEFLNGYIRNYIPAMTDEQLDELFTTYGTPKVEEIKLVEEEE